MTAEPKRHRIGVDIGGTFTDAIVLAQDGTVTIGKAPSTPPDFEKGVLDSLSSAAARMGTSLDDLLSGARDIYHGCTVGTNALVENRTARVGLLTTRGTRDTLFTMQAGGRFAGASPEYIARVAHHDKPEPIVPKNLIEEIDERVTFDGEVLVDLNEARARESIERLLDAGVEAFSISLLWSIVNGEHEQRLAQLVSEIAPDAFVSVASGVVSRKGEYERTVAAVVNSLIGPVMESYLAALESDLRAVGYEGTLFVMSCAGGVVESSYARELPLLTIGSGPVAGLIGAGSLEGEDDGNVITADMGGTTFDVGVIRNGQPLSRATSNYGQYQYFLPTLDVRSVGAGGGSLVRCDPSSRTLRVGPQSAGARPGPVAYQRGGTDPTITDADLVLGYLNPDYFLGGELSLSVEAAAEALGRVGEPLGFGPEETAAAAVRIVDNQMADAIRLASVQQGYDPRDHVMYAYGGGGPVHAPALARELGIRRIVVPLSDLAAGWSAFGTASAEAVVVEEAPLAIPAPFDPDAINSVLEQLEGKVLETMEAQGVPRESIVLERYASIRFSAQVNTVSIPIPEGPCSEESCAGLVESFEAEYARLFGAGSGYSAAGHAMTAVSVRARASRADFQFRSKKPGGEIESAEAPVKAEREVIFYERGLEKVATSIYDGGALGWGMTIEGPAVIEFVDTTIVLRDQQTAALDDLGSILIDV